jgi:hypothetical protein
MKSRVQTSANNGRQRGTRNQSDLVTNLGLQGTVAKILQLSVCLTTEEQRSVLPPKAVTPADLIIVYAGLRSYR